MEIADIHYGERNVQRKVRLIRRDREEVIFMVFRPDMPAERATILIRGNQLRSLQSFQKSTSAVIVPHVNEGYLV